MAPEPSVPVEDENAEVSEETAVSRMLVATWLSPPGVEAQTA